MENNETLKQRYLAQFENACDCLLYGYGYAFWAKRNPIENEEDAKAIWRMAFNKMANR